MVAEEGHVILIFKQRHLKEGGYVNLTHLPLIFRVDQTSQIEDTFASRAVVLVAPDCVPLPVVRTVHVDRGLEVLLPISEFQSVVQSQTMEARYVTIV